MLGVIAARRVNQWPDTLISTLGLIFYATPSFWFGLMAIVVTIYFKQGLWGFAQQRWGWSLFPTQRRLVETR